MQKGTGNLKLAQCQRILRHLKDFGAITAAEAFNEYGIMRLAARINDLRRQGNLIGRRMRTSKNRYGEGVSYAEYYLKEGKDEQL